MRDPFARLGPHRRVGVGGFAIRARQTAARAVDGRIVATGALVPMRPRGGRGLFEAVLPGPDGDEVPDYRLRVTFPGDRLLEIDDPYRYARVLPEFDLYLLGEGTHHRAFDKLGAHRVRVGSTTGVHFAVWAPNADRVSLVGD